MHKSKLLACALAAGLWSAPVHAQSGSHVIATGEDLARACADPAGGVIAPAERERLLVCGSYMRGYLGHYSAQRSRNRTAGYCLPQSGVSPEQIRELYVKVLSQRPALRDYPAAVNLLTILEAAYPCRP